MRYPCHNPNENLELISTTEQGDRFTVSLYLGMNMREPKNRKQVYRAQTARALLQNRGGFCGLHRGEKQARMLQYEREGERKRNSGRERETEGEKHGESIGERERNTEVCLPGKNPTQRMCFAFISSSHSKSCYKKRKPKNPPDLVIWGLALLLITRTKRVSTINALSMLPVRGRLKPHSACQLKGQGLVTRTFYRLLCM